MKPWKAFAILTLVLAGFTVLGCVVPHAAFVAAYGRMPLGRGQNPFAVPKGSTKEEVRAALGPPHDRAMKKDREIWFYHGDLFDFVIYSMEFDAEGRLVKVSS
jgi:outer membrane protein assembly factor BamE (lipoprotein component of BamABCDE complex)